jgi:hypothetical protein
MMMMNSSRAQEKEKRKKKSSKRGEWGIDCFGLLGWIWPKQNLQKSKSINAQTLKAQNTHGFHVGASFVHPSIHPFIHPSIHPFIHSFILSFFRSFIHLFIHSFIHPFVRSFIYSFIHSFILSFIHSFALLSLIGTREAIILKITSWNNGKIRTY